MYDFGEGDCWKLGLMYDLFGASGETSPGMCARTLVEFNLVANRAANYWRFLLPSFFRALTRSSTEMSDLLLPSKVARLDRS